MFLNSTNLINPIIVNDGPCVYVCVSGSSRKVLEVKNPIGFNVQIPSAPDCQNSYRRLRVGDEIVSQTIHYYSLFKEMSHTTEPQSSVWSVSLRVKSLSNFLWSSCRLENSLRVYLQPRGLISTLLIRSFFKI